MRRRRAVFFAVMAADLVMLLYSGERLYLYVLGLMVMTLLLCGLQLLIGLLAFRYSPRFSSEREVAGGVVTMRMQLSNEAWTPLPYLMLRFRTIQTAWDGRLEEVAVSLGARASHTVPVELHCDYRGVYPVGPVEVQLRDVLGLLSVRMKMSRLNDRKPQDLVVLPRAEALPQMRLPLQEQEGQASVHTHGTEDTSSLAQVRAWRPGDPMKRIHWKLTARTHKVQIKEYEEPSRPDVVVYLDCASHGEEGLTAVKLEDAMTSAAATIVNVWLGQTVATRLIAYPDQRQELEGQRPSDFEAFQDYLARVAFQGPYPLEDILKLELDRAAGANSVVVVTASRSQALFNTLLNLTTAGVALTCILVAPEEDEAARLAPDSAARMVQEMVGQGMQAVLLHPGEGLALAYERGMRP